MQTQLTAALASEHETSVQSIRRNLTQARDQMRAMTLALEAINARLGKRG